MAALVSLGVLKQAPTRLRALGQPMHTQAWDRLMRPQARRGPLERTQGTSRSDVPVIS